MENIAQQPRARYVDSPESLARLSEADVRVLELLSAITNYIEVGDRRGAHRLLDICFLRQAAIGDRAA
jgi:hypothetical protein